MTNTPPIGADASYYRNLSVAAANRGDFLAAANYMQECCRLQPQSVEYQFQLGSLLAHLREFPQAISHFERATQLAPDFAQAWRFLGRCLKAIGWGMQACAPLQRAHTLQPDDTALLKELAELEFQSGFPEDALPLWRKVFALEPNNLDAILKLGESLGRMGLHAEATHHYQTVIATQGENPDLWMALGQAHEDEADRDAAQAAYLRALALRPAWAFPLAGLIELRRGKAHSDWVSLAVELRNKPSTSPADNALLGFALGKYYDANNDYTAALSQWSSANSARQQVIGPSDASELIAQTDRSIRQFAPCGVAAFASSGIEDERPVFIVGMPRSGTTLTEQIIAAHPQASGCGELPHISLIARSFRGFNGNSIAWPEVAPFLDTEALSAAAKRYLDSATRHASDDGSLRLVDKAPLNYYHLGLIAMLLPKARIIWCRRDPRDIAISVFGENFSLEERLATSLQGIGHYINQEDRLMRHWQSVLSLPILELQYEQLVSDQEAQSRRIIDFVGLPWDEACLQFHRSEQGVQTPSRWQVKQPVHTRSIGRWRNYAFGLAPLLQTLDASTYAGLPAQLVE